MAIFLLLSCSSAFFSSFCNPSMKQYVLFILSSVMPSSLAVASHHKLFEPFLKAILGTIIIVIETICRAA